MTSNPPVILNRGDHVAVKTYDKDPTQTPHLFVNGVRRCALSPEGVERVRLAIAVFDIVEAAQ